MNIADQPLVIEMLIPSDSRRERITIEAHDQFHQSIITEAPVVFDEIDMAVAGELIENGEGSQ